MAGRPKTFDPEQALEQAMHLFWLHGYEATSLHTLLEGMGISRQSSYDTFGGKQALFIKALKVYDRMILQHVQELLDGGSTPVDSIRRMLGFFVEQGAVQPFRGCMINNSAVELGQRDEAVGEIVRQHWARLERMIEKVLAEAAEAGELAPEADLTALARFFLGTIQGLLVVGKAKADPAVARDIARVALRSLEASPAHSVS